MLCIGAKWFVRLSVLHSEHVFIRASKLERDGHVFLASCDDVLLFAKAPTRVSLFCEQVTFDAVGAAA